MPRVPCALLLLLLLPTAACAPACGDGGDVAARHDVALLVERDGLIAQAAADRLVRRGRAAIAVVETGLYAADVAGRKRVIRTLERIDRMEARPIFEHLARHDPDPDVRQAARTAAAKACGARPVALTH